MAGRGALFISWLAFEKALNTTSPLQILLWASGAFIARMLQLQSRFSDTGVPITAILLLVSVPHSQNAWPDLVHTFFHGKHEGGHQAPSQLSRGAVSTGAPPRWRQGIDLVDEDHCGGGRPCCCKDALHDRPDKLLSELPALMLQ